MPSSSAALQDGLGDPRALREGGEPSWVARREGRGPATTSPSLHSPPRESVSVVLGQHFFNRTTDVTQTFGIEKYIPYPLYSVFNPSDHDLGEAQTHWGAAGLVSGTPCTQHRGQRVCTGGSWESSDVGGASRAGQKGPWGGGGLGLTEEALDGQYPAAPRPQPLYPSGLPLGVPQWPRSSHHGLPHPRLTAGLSPAQS